MEKYFRVESETVASWTRSKWQLESESIRMEGKKRMMADIRNGADDLVINILRVKY